MSVDQNGPSAKGPNHEGVVIDGCGAGKYLGLDKGTAIARQRRELPSIQYPKFFFCCYDQESLSIQRLQNYGESSHAFARGDQLGLFSFQFPEPGRQVGDVDGVPGFLHDGAACVGQLPDAESVAIPTESLVCGRENDASRSDLDSPNGYAIVIPRREKRCERSVVQTPGSIFFAVSDHTVATDPDPILRIYGNTVDAKITA